MDTRDMLIYLDIYYKHDWDKVYEALLTKDRSAFEENNSYLVIETKLYGLLNQGYRVLTLIDEEYPDKIKFFSHKPPFVIYYKEDLETVADRYDTTKYDRSKGCFID